MRTGPPCRESTTTSALSGFGGDDDATASHEVVPTSGLEQKVAAAPRCGESLPVRATSAQKALKSSSSPAGKTCGQILD